jgi:gamma-glutamyl-gamma-aminobutyrate hydrolase PuuD
MSVAVAISQRVQLIAEYGERRDWLDQQWAAFLHACDLLPIPVPNFPTGVDSLLSHARVRGIVLTGGLDIDPDFEIATHRDQRQIDGVRNAEGEFRTTSRRRLAFG